MAQAIREQIRTELHLTASAGVAPNKFLAKIASNWRKPDGLFVIQPKDIPAFLHTALRRIPGVGKVTEARLEKLRVRTVGLPPLQQAELGAFGSAGTGFGFTSWPAASTKTPSCPTATQSVSAEDTFPEDVPLSETEPLIRALAEDVECFAQGRPHCAHRGPETEDQGIQNPDPQSHPSLAARLVRRTHRNSPFVAQ